MPCPRLALLLVATLAPFAAATNDLGKAFLAKKASEPGVVTRPSGLMYKVLREGPSEGAMHPMADSSCSCHYKGTLIDGTEFDSSYGRGDPTDFAPNQVIGGWTEAMQLMVEGDKWEMYIPSDLGYGEQGSPPKIQGGDALVFVMEIIKINGQKVPAIRCDPSDGNKGCNEKEIKYVKKINSKFGDEAGKKALAAAVPTLGEKEALVKWMNEDLGIKIKKGKLSRSWTKRIRRILHKLTNPTVRDEA